MTMATSSVPRNRAGKKKREIEEKLKKGTSPDAISSDWQELEILYSRAGLSDLYDKEGIIERAYVPKPFISPEDQAFEDAVPGAVASSTTTADTFNDIEEEEEEEINVTEDVVADDFEDEVAVVEDGEIVEEDFEEDFEEGVESDPSEAEALRQNRYNEIVALLEEDPNRRDINVDSLFSEDPELGRLVSNYLSSDAYFEAQRQVDLPAESGGDSADDDDAEVSAPTDYTWNYLSVAGDLVKNNYKNVKAAVSEGQDITGRAADILLQSGASIEDARANAADLASFLVGRAQRELDEEAEAQRPDPVEEPEPEPEPEPDVSEAVVPEETAVPEEPVVTEEPVVAEEPVVDQNTVVDVAGNEVIPANDAVEDMDNAVNEILRLIEDVDFSDVSQVDDVRGTIVGVFEDYGADLNDILSIESASNIIDTYIDDILSQSLAQSTRVFEDTDADLTFGREAEAGIEISMENIINSIAIDEQEILEKTTTLINNKYDDALERLGRLGLLEGGGITASGVTIRQAEEIETARANELIQAELDVGQQYRAELRETLQLFENIKRSRAEEAIDEQRVRIDTTQQLLNFVVSLEEIRLGTRAADVAEGRLGLEARSLDLEDYRTKADERLREAELVGNLDGEETLAMREVLSRIELDKKRLDLEAKISDRELTIQEKAQALNELLGVKQLNLEAKRFNLEEALGLGGLDLNERRVALDEIMGRAGIGVDERRLALDTLLGEGELAVRRDLAAAEIEQVSVSNYLAKNADRRADLELQLQEGEINSRIALETRRLDLEQFIASNDIELRNVGLDIERSRVDQQGRSLNLESRRIDLVEAELAQRADESAEEFSIRRDEMAQRLAQSDEEFELRRSELEQRADETDEEFAFRREELEQEAFLREQQLELQRELETARLDYESTLGFARLEQEGERISLEERKLLLDEMVEVGRLDLATQQLAFEEIQFNQQYSLEEKRYYSDKLLAERGLDQRDRELATAELVANARITQDELELEYSKLSDEKRLALEERGLVIREDMSAAEIQRMNREMNLSEERLALEKTSMDNVQAAQAFEQQMALADRLGYYIDASGEVIPTLAASNAAQEIELRERGLNIEADRLAASTEQFTLSFNQATKEWAAANDLNLRETEALIARTNADIADQEARLKANIEQMDNENAISWENLRLRGVEIEAGREATEEEMAFRREQLAIQIEQQNLDRANDMFKFSEQMDLSLQEFETLNDRWETEWAFSTQQAAQEFGLREDEFAILKYQVEQEIALRGKSLDDAAAQWASEFGLEEERVLQALRQDAAIFEEQLNAMAIENDLSQQEFEMIKAKMTAFNKEEQKRDETWELLMEDFDWDDENAIKNLSAHMALLNGATGLPGGQGQLFENQPGLLESITGFGTSWLVKTFGDDIGKSIESKIKEEFGDFFF
tara:strand:- start:7145 stop:11422 length:4278 start_codon:yes stop_codon:yes gene_type:complete